MPSVVIELVNGSIAAVYGSDPDIEVTVEKRHASKHEYDNVIHDTNLLNMRIRSRGAMLTVHHGFLSPVHLT